VIFCSEMGYSTDFLGSLKFSRPLRDKEVEFLNAFSECRRMKLDVQKLQETCGKGKGNPFAKTEDEVFGIEGEYCIEELPYNSPIILEYNEPPSSQPSLWCHWIVTKTELKWNGAEKFYNYIEWLQYLITHFFDKWSVALDGAMQWQGEDRTDRGTISVWSSKIHIHHDACDEYEEDD
jgi:hypothetical protein